IKSLAYLSLAFDEVCFECGKIGRIARPREPHGEAAGGICRIEHAFHADTDHLRQIMVKADRMDEHVCRLARQYARLRNTKQRRARMGMADFGMAARMDELQILADELDIHESAAHMLQLPWIVAFPLPCKASAHIGNISSNLRPVARAKDRP